jgi:trk system potassium uptake protein TrkA
MSEMSGTVTQWLKPNQPLALWWQRNYPGLRQVSRDLAARLGAARTKDQAPGTNEPALPSTAIITIPVDTPGLRYYDYGLLGGAIDYRMRMEFTHQWGGDPERSAFTRAWAGKRGSLAHAAAALLADCAPALIHARSHTARLAHLAVSLPALASLLEERAARLDELAPWDWTGPYATSQREEPWLQDYCFVLAELDNFYRTYGAGTHFDFMPLLSPSGYRSAMYASGRPVRSDFWGPGRLGTEAAEDEWAGRQHDAAARVISELERSWPLFAYLCSTSGPTLEELASVACGAGRSKGSERLPLLRRDLAAQLALWHRNPARRGPQPPRVIAANPTFAGSTRLPADGDLIVRSKEGTGYLIDFKSASDEVNVVTARVARQVFKVPRVVAHLYDPRKAEIYKRLGLQTVTPITWGINRIADILCYSGLDTVASLGNGAVDIVDAEVPRLLAGRPVADVTVHGEINVGAITRRGQTFLPSPDTIFQEGDLAHFVLLAASADRLRQLLALG